MGCGAGAGAASPLPARLTALYWETGIWAALGAEVGAGGNSGTVGAVLPTQTSTSSKNDIFFLVAGGLPHQNAQKNPLNHSDQRR